MSRAAPTMPRYLLYHQHQPHECRVSFAAWRGFESPLRKHPATASCSYGGHQIWWEVEAADPATALAVLPDFVAERTRVTRVGDWEIP